MNMYPLYSKKSRRLSTSSLLFTSLISMKNIFKNFIFFFVNTNYTYQLPIKNCFALNKAPILPVKVINETNFILFFII